MVVIVGGILIAFCFAYYFDQKRKIRNKQGSERKREKYEQLLSRLKHRGKTAE